MAYRERTETISLTRAEILTLISNNNLVPNYEYFITDRNIWLTARSNNTFASSGQRSQRIIKNTYYTPQTIPGFFTINILGIYGQTIAQGSVPNSNSTFGGTVYYAIWGGRIWQRNNSGADGGATIDGEITSGWTAIVNTDVTFYETKIFEVGYNIETDVISFQSDDRNNRIRNLTISGYETVNITDWGNVLISNNQCAGVFNNYGNTLPVLCSSNICFETISRNRLIGGGNSIRQNRCQQIVNNQSLEINNNILTNNILNNTLTLQLTQNIVGGSISGNTAQRIIVNMCNGSIVNNNIGTNSIDYNIINSIASINSIFNNTNNGNIRNNICHSINNNSNSDAIINNRCRHILNNSNIGVINNNTNSSNIESNANNGVISFNFNTGSINNNSVNVLGIFNNSNNGQISSNNNSENISFNTNNGNINNNFGPTIIFRNNCLGNINNNNCAQISSNFNRGAIENNTVSNISFNKNNGEISNNTGVIIIENNINTGGISNNIANVGAIVGISRNRNNGNISGMIYTSSMFVNSNINNGNIGPGFYAVTVSDPIVNK
jgi:hypothetical protein